MRAHSPIVAIFLFLSVCSGCGEADPVAEIRAQQERAHYGATLEPLRALLQQRPDDPELHFLYGVALARTGQPGLAIWSLRRAQEDELWAVAAGLELAADAFAARSYRAAEEAATAVLTLEPDNLEALRLRGEARLEDKADLEGALADFEEILVHEPVNFAAQLSRFATLLILERAEDAQASLAELEKLAAEEHADKSALASLCVARAIFAKERKEIATADQNFETCLDQHPIAPLVVDEAAKFYDEQGRSERAIEIFRVALDKAPEATAYRSELARRLRNQGRVSDAEKLLREGTQVESKRAAAEAWSVLAEHHLSLDELPEAVEAVERAAALTGAPSQQELLAYADLLAAAEMNERALEVAQDLEQKSYQQLVRARVLLNERRPREALELYKKALELWPNNAVARYYAARAAEQIGDFEAAVEQYRQSIRAGAQATDAALRLAQLRAAEGDARAADSALAQHLRAHPGEPEATLLAIELARRANDQKRLRYFYSQLRPSPLRARAAAMAADATAAKGGPRAAIAVLRGDPRLDFTSPRDVEALRSLVAHLLEAGDTGSARAALGAALAARPDDSRLHEIRGRLLEHEGGRKDEVEAAYRRALELDPGSPHALEALGRMAASSGRLEEALSLLCDRAVGKVPSEPAPSLRCAARLVVAGRHSEAEARLEALLREVPWSSEAALALARLHWDRQAGASAIELAQRAVRFSGGPEARSFLEQIRQGG